MCLAAPGKVLRIFNENGIAMGELDFGGICKTVCLAYVPEIKVNEYAMVHAGFALDRIDEEEVVRFYQLWQQVLDAEADRPHQKNEDASGSAQTAGKSPQ